MSEQNSGEQPPRPRYGEYAPPGWTPPQEQPHPSSAPQYPPAQQPAPPAAPGWGAQQQPGAQQPGAQQPAPGGVPQYPGAQASYNPAGWGEAAAPQKKRNTVDVVFTIILLVIGLLSAGYGVLTGIGLSSKELFNQQLREIYGGDPNIDAGPWGIVIVISNIVLYLAALGLSILSLLRRRITFWIPLVAGVIAFVVFVIAVFALFSSDPTYFEQVGSR
jgi:hypothetical protein